MGESIQKELEAANLLLFLKLGSACYREILFSWKKSHPESGLCIHALHSTVVIRVAIPNRPKVGQVGNAFPPLL